jgi:hypothetical protein
MWALPSCNRHDDLQGGSLVFDQALSKRLEAYLGELRERLETPGVRGTGAGRQSAAVTPHRPTPSWQGLPGAGQTAAPGLPGS